MGLEEDLESGFKTWPPTKGRESEILVPGQLQGQLGESVGWRSRCLQITSSQLPWAHSQQSIERRRSSRVFGHNLIDFPSSH